MWPQGKHIFCGLTEYQKNILQHKTWKSIPIVSHVIHRKTHFMQANGIWGERFKIKDLDANNRYWCTCNSQENFTWTEGIPEKHLKMKDLVLLTSLTIHNSGGSQENTFYVDWRDIK